MLDLGLVGSSLMRDTALALICNEAMIATVNLIRGSFRRCTCAVHGGDINASLSSVSDLRAVSNWVSCGGC